MIAGIVWSPTPRRARRFPALPGAWAALLVLALPGAWAALLVLALLPSGEARADGPGVPVGETARLHFQLELEGRYDSLAGQGGIGANTLTPVQDPAEILLHIKPGIRLNAPGNRVDFDANANLDWTRYTGWLAPDSDFSYFGGSAGAGLEMGKGGPVGLKLSEAFNRSDRTTNPALGAGTITNSNNLGARLGFVPGGGAIEGGVGYDFGLEVYSAYRPNIPSQPPQDPSSDPTLFGGFGSQTHRFSLDARWRFLPKTAFVLNASWALRYYDSSTVNVASKPLLIEGGLSGLITEKVRVLLRGGWAKSFSDATAAKPDEFSGPIAQAEIGWNPTDTTGISLGVQRSVEPVSTFGWYDDWRVYASGRLALGGRVALTASGKIDRLVFANGGRADTQASLDAAADIEAFRLVHVVLGGVLTSRDSTASGFYVYQRTEVYLRLVASY